MLVLSRRIGEKILLDNGVVEITVVAIGQDKVRIGVDAPPHMTVNREEVQIAIDKAKPTDD